MLILSKKERVQEGFCYQWNTKGLQSAVKAKPAVGTTSESRGMGTRKQSTTGSLGSAARRRTRRLVIKKIRFHNHFLLIYSFAFKNDSRCFCTSWSLIFEAKIDESTEAIVFYLSCCFRVTYFKKSFYSWSAFFFCRIWIFSISNFNPFSFCEVYLYLSFAFTIYCRIAYSSGSYWSFPSTRFFTAFYRLMSSSSVFSFPILSRDWWMSVAISLPCFIFYFRTSAFFWMASCLLEDTLKASKALAWSRRS